MNDVSIAGEYAKIIDNIYTRRVERANERNIGSVTNRGNKRKIGSQIEPILQAGISCTNAFGRFPTIKKLASHL